MKYAKMTDRRAEKLNIGHPFQLMAIDNLYQHMGIDPKEIVSIDTLDLESYNGEQVVLPINYLLSGVIQNISPNIIPVYLGISLLSFSSDVYKFCEYGPVGCRDFYTYNLLKKNGVDAYFGGCITTALPRRDKNIKGDKIFFVDVPDALLPYIPTAYLEQGEFLSHLPGPDVNEDNAYHVAMQLWEYYLQRAKLIVTSRLHCALPAVAAGIPTIFVKDHLDYRLSAIRGFLPLYSKDDYAEIDWMPVPLEFESLKQDMLNYAAWRLSTAHNKTDLDETLHQDYCKRISRFFYGEKKDTFPVETLYPTLPVLEQYIEMNFTSEAFMYILWGYNQMAEVTYELISKRWPNANMVAMVDEYKDICFQGKHTARKEIIREYPDALVLVTSTSAKGMAEEFSKSIGHKHCLWVYL